MVTFQEMKPEQIPVAVSIIREAFSTVSREYGLTPENCPTNPAFFTEERLRSELARGARCFLLETEGEPVGFAELMPEQPGSAEMNHLAVRPACRQSGLGKALVHGIVEEAGRMGVSVLHIGIMEQNQRLKQWYASLGFQPVGTYDFPHLPFTVGFMKMEI